MKNFFTILLLFCTLNILAQGEANFWFFGQNAGINFNSGNPVAISGSRLNTNEGCSSFSDKNGNLLFYSDGTTVWDKTNTPMPNGNGTLKGHSSSTQSAIIVPDPGDKNQFYIFTVGAILNNIGEFGFHCYTIDMTANSGLGDVVGAEIDLSDGRNQFWSEKVASVKGNSCNTFWIVSLVENTYYSYKVDINGLNPAPVKSVVNYFSGDRRGYLKISPDGKKLASATFTQYYDNENNVNVLGKGKLHLYSFNDVTGEVSNDGIDLITNVNADGVPYGIEFSPNSTKLYTSTYNGYYNKLIQFDLESANIAASKSLVNSQIGYRGGLQLAPNGKIYATVPVSYTIGTNYLNAINSPNEQVSESNFQPNALNLGTGYAMQGLPPFIASLLLPVEITDGISTQNLNNTTVKRCIGENYELTPQNISGSPVYTWTFNNVIITNSATLSIPSLNPSNNGTYYLEIKTTDDCGFSIVYKGEVTIEVYEPPTINKPNNINQCDNDNNGFYSFNLNTLKDIEVLQGQSLTTFEVVYFTNQADADANRNAIVNPYKNSSAFGTDVIIARIHNIQNPICYETESFTLQVFESPKPLPTITNLFKCDSNVTGTDTDGIEIFDLTQKETEILNGQLTTDFTIEYYIDAALSNQIPDPSAFQNSTTIQTIYVKIFNNLNISCAAFTNFDVEVFELPTITTPVTLKQCDNDNDGYSSFNLTEVNSEISTNSTNETFTYFKTYISADTNDRSLQILNPTTYSNSTINTATVWARAENSNGCHHVSEINLVVSTTLIPDTFQREFYQCDDFLDAINDEKDGITTFDFSSVTSEILALFPNGQQLIINYYRNEADALSEINPISDPSSYRNNGYPNQQTIYVRVDSQLDNDCLGLGAHITLNVEPIPIANNVSISRQCDDDFDGFFPFDTSFIETTVLNGQAGMVVSYVDENGNPLSSPLPNPFSSNSQTITIRVTDSNSIDPDGSCFAETTIEFIVDKKPIANIVPNRIECDDNFDGIFPFDTSLIETTVLNGQTGMVVYYSDENGNSLSSPLPNPFFSSSQTITVKVQNELNNICSDETTIAFLVNPKPDFELNETAIYCLNLPPIIVETYKPAGNYSYQWKNENGQIISTDFDAAISSAGEYTVIATSNEGCESFPHVIKIMPSIVASIAQNDITVVDDSENNSITINTTNLGIGDYEFAIKKIDEFISNFQDEPYFENLKSGIYTIFIQDKNNCGIAQIEVSVIGYPKFFTPNNDGYNDTWNVLGVNENFYQQKTVYIFDRFGKLITEIGLYSEGWDGTFNGNFLPETDYWFSVELIDLNGNVRIKKGHFSLIR